MTEHSPLIVTALKKGKQDEENKTIYDSYHLGYKVRLKMLQKIILFDEHHQGMIEGRQILQALKFILGEQREQIQGIYKQMNEKLGDIVRYQDIVNACLEEGLGVAAIEKLDHHKQQNTNNNTTNLITQAQFIDVLKNPLQSLGLQIEDKELLSLYHQIQRNQGQGINFKEFLLFIKEYFGSGCIGGDNVIQPKNTKPIENENEYLLAVARVGKLLWPQYKELIMKNDTVKNKKFTDKTQFQKLEKEFNLELIKFHKQSYSYDQILKEIIDQKFCRSKQSQKQFEQQSFIEQFYQNKISKLKNKPSRYLLEQIFHHLSAGISVIDSHIYHKFLIDLAKTFSCK